MPRKKGIVDPQPTKKRLGGRWVWWARWAEWVDGQRRRPEQIIGDVEDFPTKADARDRLQEILRERSGRVVPMAAGATFADVWKRYLALKRPRWSRAHAGSVEPVMRRAVLPAIGERPVAALTPEPLQVVLNQMAEAKITVGKENPTVRVGYSNSAMAKARIYMKAVFDFAVDERLIERNPALKLELPEARKSADRFLTLDEVRRLLTAAEGIERLVLRLLLVGGLRPGELFALRAEDVGEITVRIDEAVKERERQSSGRRIGKTKTRKVREIALSAELHAELRALAAALPPNVLLFPNTAGGTWRITGYLKRVVKPLAASVGIGGVTLQAMRRTFTTHFAQTGAITDAQAQLGHTTPSTTLKHYAKPIPESLREAVERLDAKFTQEAKVQ